MSEIFADTSGWATFFLRTEPRQQEAEILVSEWREAGDRIITTNYVLAELIALFGSPLRVPRDQQIRMIEAIRQVSWVEVVHVDPTLDQRAWQLLKQHADKQWSLVDCASFCVMRDRGITAALATDRHFVQAGFRALLA